MSEVAPDLRLLYYYLLESECGWKVKEIYKHPSSYRITLIDETLMHADIILWKNQ